MKDTTTSVLGFDVPVSGYPTDLQECIAAAGGEQKLVTGWTDYIKFHKTNTDARSAVVDALENVLGVERETETVKQTTSKGVVKEVEKYAESEQTFAQRAIAQSGKTKQEIWDLIKDQVGTVEFKAEGRGPGVGKLPKQDTAMATTLIEADDKWPKAVQLLEQKNPGLKVEMDENGKPKVESLAAALRTNRKRLESESAAELGIAA
jgi:hypothetical protein